MGLSRTATFCVLLALAPAGGLIAAESGPEVTSDAYAAPDNRVPMGGDRVLNLRCSGSGEPVVILEAGGNADSSVWFRVQPRIAGSTRVCAYDRAGYGFSDEGPLPRDLDAFVSDLRALIEAAEIAEPVVLVGHSLGSNIVRRYAQKHPSGVAALVLVDPPEQGSDSRLPEEWQEQIAAQVAQRAGVLDLCERAALEDDAETIQGRCLREAPAWMSAAVAEAMTSNKSEPRYWRTLRAELEGNVEVFASPVPSDESYGALPLLLLRATDPTEDAPPEILAIIAKARSQTHAGLLAASARSELIDVSNTSHDIQLDQPEQVASAVTRLVASLSAADQRPAEARARQPIAVASVDDAWRAALPRDAKLATQAYLDRLPAANVQRANQYEEGGYWLQLWEFLLGLAIAALMLGGRRAARVRDWAQRVGRYAPLRDGLFGAVYGASAALLGLPLNFYRSYVREHSYGMSTQGPSDWWSEWAVSLGLEAVGAAIAVAVLYAVIRRAGERWWLWGAAACSALLALMLLVQPVWIAPLFNTYQPLEPGPVRDAVLSMARANGVPTDEIYAVDASRQTQRISANVSGLGSRTQIRLNDNLLNRTSLPEIRAVMAHELGHYVLNHAPKMLIQFSLLILFGFLFSQWAMRRLFARFGTRWGTQSVGDVASLPLLAAVFSVFMLAATPVFNTIIRTQEIEADRFGLNLAREPHGFAEAMLKLADYRKPDAGALEEVVFFHHPSARHRIHDAMRWREAMGTP